MRHLHRLPATAVLAVVLVLSVPSAALTVSAGWTNADVGLDARGDGFYLGVGGRLHWDNPVFDARVAVEYVQKKGSQPTAFAHPTGGFSTGDAEVTLHVVEPAIFLGARAAGLPLVPRIYAGLSVGLKVKESWSDFPGIPDRAWAYKDSDLVWHLGATVELGPVTVDGRFSGSLVGQLLNDSREQPLDPLKAADDGDVREPEEGFRTELWRVGVGFDF